MRALNRFAVAVVLAGIFVGAAAAQVQTGQSRSDCESRSRQPPR